MIETDAFEKVEVRSRTELRDWLAANHAQDASVWLVTFKKKRPEFYLSRWDVLDELLCFGWIDGIRRKLDDDRTMQLISPRKQQVWTRTYKDRAARLEKEDLMTDPGREAVQRSKKLGLWNGSDHVDKLVVPDDLRTALDAAPPASDWFDESAPSYRRNLLRWIDNAVRPETRAKRIGEVSAACAARRKIPNM
jgi:uncharacterized protein YdeI (YjbR/CyaY-like superfamily)